MFFIAYVHCVVYSLKYFKLKTEEQIINVHFPENFTKAESKIHAYPGLVSQVLNDKGRLFEMWITQSTG